MLRHNIIVPLQFLDQEIPKWECMLNCCSDCPIMNAPGLESPEQLDRLFTGSLHKTQLHIFQNIFKIPING